MNQLFSKCINIMIYIITYAGDCSCNDPSGRCVMSAVSGFPSAEQWSSCSVNQLENSLTRVFNNLGRCLGNEPPTTVGDPVCGNGIREGDEVCDCGTSEVRIHMCVCACGLFIDEKQCF